MAFAFLGVQLAVFGVYMGASFAPNHKGMPIIDHDAKLDFFTKQVLTSRNVSGGWWATIAHGRPQLPDRAPPLPEHAAPAPREGARDRARALRARSTCPTPRRRSCESYGIVIEYLNRVGLSARDPFDCPMVASSAGSDPR